MIGRIDASGRSFIAIAVRQAGGVAATQMEAWIDTGFIGDLVLPKTMVEQLGLLRTGTAGAELGDGSRVVMGRFACVIEWFGAEREVDVIANNGRIPLVGVSLLEAHRLTIDYPARALTLE
jgi:clan AA aspartic protease